jgi:hypothetical protein
LPNLPNDDHRREKRDVKPLLCTTLTLLSCGSVLADSNFVSNPHLPYPPACARIPWVAQGGGQEAKFFDEVIEMYDGVAGKPVAVRLEGHRSACTEPNRSLLWLTFSLLESHPGKPVRLELPFAVAETPNGFRRGMNLVTEPNGWGTGGQVDRARIYLVSENHGTLGAYASPDLERKWVFLLDNAAPEAWSSGTPGLSPTEYNAAFRLVLRYPPYDFLTIEVPAGSEVLSAPAPRLPLSGRHSGTWVIEGAADQGFQLAISEPVSLYQGGSPDDEGRPLMIFFSQYTFDAQARPLWLVGNAEFEPGASAVTIPVAKVASGDFRGSKRASREIVGSVTLTSNSCNDIQFAYDYADLGAGTRRLQRLFSLETAGYACRDYEARVAANR